MYDKMYEINKIYVWQNQVGEYASLNGVETTVVSEAFDFTLHSTFETRIAWQTDTYAPGCPRIEENRMVAFVGDLRPKDPPSGEQKILELFNNVPELEPA